MSTEQEKPVNHAIEAVRPFFSLDTRELGDGEIDALSMIVCDSLLTEDYETLKYIADVGDRLQSPASISNPEQRAAVDGLRKVAHWGLKRLYLPELTEEQTNLFKQISEGKYFYDLGEDVTEDADQLHRTGLIGIGKIPYGNFFSSVTPRGQRMLEKLSQPTKPRDENVG